MQRKQKSKLLKRYQSKSLLLLGFVEEEDLAALYNLATLYCQPSFMRVLAYGGRGHGRRLSGGLLQSRIITEIGGEAVAYFDPWVKNDLEKS